MSVLDAILSELARLRSGDEPIVSLYLDIRWSDEQQRDRVRLFLREELRRTRLRYREGSPGREGLLRTLVRMQRYVSERGRLADQNGLALFASEALGLWRPFFFHHSFRPELCTDHVPHLKQLARLADDGRPALVVVVDSNGAELYQVLLGALTVEESLRGFVPRRDKDEYNPGAAAHGRHFEREEKDVRHAETFVQRNRRRVVQEAEVLHARLPGSRLVLMGTAGNVAAFERELPGRLRAAVIARMPRPRRWESGNGSRKVAVVAGAQAALRECDRQAEAETVERVVKESLHGGLAVLGPDDVVAAVNEGRVERLVLEEDFARAGWRCTHCDALGPDAEAAEVCPYCGGALAVVHHLDEALVARTIGEGGAVEVVSHSNRLHSYDSVGAFLRQTSGTLRGSIAPA
ncbi:MAG TPA: hypothetical protein VFG59_18090 [Anaeromyxobacter sp.]|nr:hypothetical protein [Anaeromyxobacter sp.]